MKVEYNRFKLDCLWKGAIQQTETKQSKSILLSSSYLYVQVVGTEGRRQRRFEREWKEAILGKRHFTRGNVVVPPVLLMSQCFCGFTFHCVSSRSPICPLSHGSPFLSCSRLTCTPVTHLPVRLLQYIYHNSTLYFPPHCSIAHVFLMAKLRLLLSLASDCLSYAVLTCAVFPVSQCSPCPVSTCKL